jgi:CelD/BcsL family acetyltransferase involved in cellulose biosynthesis
LTARAAVPAPAEGARLERLMLPATDAAGRATLNRLGVAVPALQLRTRPPNVFHDPALLQAATALTGPIALHWLERGGVPAALVPVTWRRHGFGLLGRLPHGVGHSYGPAGTPAIAADLPAADVARLLEAARGGAAALVLPYLEQETPAVAVIVEAARLAGLGVWWTATHRRAGLDITAAGPDYFDRELSRKRRKEWQRQARRLAEAGTIEHRVDRAPETLATALADVVALEAQGWKGRRGTALAFHAEGLAFAEAAVGALGPRGAVRIDRLSLDGRTIAGLVSFVAAGRMWIWKTAYDEAEARFSPGVQLMLRVTTDLIGAPGLRSADSLATADHPMIDPLWTDRITVATAILAPRRSPVGPLLAAEAAAHERARAMARRLLRR